MANLLAHLKIYKEMQASCVFQEFTNALCFKPEGPGFRSQLG